MDAGILGFLAVIVSALSYGSYYVAARKHEIHDGLVFQWYQCIGLLLAGCTFSLVRNDWSAPAGESPAFYVHPEGLISGLLYQLANVVATKAVQLSGIGFYYTVHEVTNVGTALLVGIVGPHVGVPAKEPSNLSFALIGAAVVGLGMAPIMFVEDTVEEDIAEAVQAPVKVVPAEALPAVPELKEPGAVYSKLSDLFPPVPALTEALSMQLQQNAHTWDGAAPLLNRYRGHVHHEVFGPHGSFLAVPTVPIVGDEEEVMQEESTPSKTSSEHTKRQLCGAVLSLVAGSLYALMFAPMPYWSHRMRASGFKVDAFDFVFPVCVGAAISSTAWLLFWGAVKSFKNQILQKSVLRPALLSGVIYFVAVVFEFYAVVALPYAVAYCSVTGTALAVSLSWGILVFGEMKGTHNRRMAFLSFLGVFVGVVCLGVSA